MARKIELDLDLEIRPYDQRLINGKLMEFLREAAGNPRQALRDAVECLVLADKALAQAERHIRWR